MVLLILYLILAVPQMRVCFNILVHFASLNMKSHVSWPIMQTKILFACRNPSRLYNWYRRTLIVDTMGQVATQASRVGQHTSVISCLQILKLSVT